MEPDRGLRPQGLPCEHPARAGQSLSIPLACRPQLLLEATWTWSEAEPQGVGALHAVGSVKPASESPVRGRACESCQAARLPLVLSPAGVPSPPHQPRDKSGPVCWEEAWGLVAHGWSGVPPEARRVGTCPQGLLCVLWGAPRPELLEHLGLCFRFLRCHDTVCTLRTVLPSHRSAQGAGCHGAIHTCFLMFSEGSLLLGTSWCLLVVLLNSPNDQ